jgi:ribonuclease E
VVREPAAADEAAEPAEATAEAAAEEAPPARSRSRRRSRSRNEETPEPAAAAPASGGLGEVIDLGEEAASAIVEVPEADAPQRPRRERVRKPVTAVLADVVTAVVERATPGHHDAAPEEGEVTTAEAPAPEAAPSTPAEAEPQPEPAARAEAEPEPQSEPAAKADEEAEQEREPVSANDAPASEAEKTADAPKRRGWWSRAIGGA